MPQCNNKPYTSQDKWIVAIIVGLLFLLIASPFFYNAINSLTSSFGLVIVDADGCANIGGLLLHSIIFVLIIRLLMR